MSMCKHLHIFTVLSVVFVLSKRNSVESKKLFNVKQGCSANIFDLDSKSDGFTEPCSDENPYCSCEPLGTYASEKLCHPIVGAPCVIGGDGSLACTKSASCTSSMINMNKDKVENIGRCACDSGFLASPHGECLVGIGGECDKNGLKCNVYAGLKCGTNSGKCECASTDLVYEENVGCAAQANEPCGPLYYLSDLQDYVYIYCQENLRCSKRPGNGLLHVCQEKSENV